MRKVRIKERIVGINIEKLWVWFGVIAFITTSASFISDSFIFTLLSIIYFVSYIFTLVIILPITLYKLYAGKEKTGANLQLKNTKPKLEIIRNGNGLIFKLGEKQASSSFITLKRLIETEGITNASKAIKNSLIKLGFPAGNLSLEELENGIKKFETNKLEGEM